MAQIKTETGIAECAEFMKKHSIKTLILCNGLEGPGVKVIYTNGTTEFYRDSPQDQS